MSTRTVLGKGSKISICDLTGGTIGDAPVWVEIEGVKTITLNYADTKEDVTNPDSNGWKESVVTLRELTIDIDGDKKQTLDKQPAEGQKKFRAKTNHEAVVGYDANVGYKVEPIDDDAFTCIGTHTYTETIDKFAKIGFSSTITVSGKPIKAI